MKPKSKGSASKPASKPGVAGALTIAKLLDTPDPALQIERLQVLLDKAVSPVYTLVIVADGRQPAGTVLISNVGPAISGPIANMMLAAAQHQLAEAQAQAEAQARAEAKAPQPAAVPPAAKSKKSE
jgi:hypothetical protein